jgi:hypothetical protein
VLCPAAPPLGVGVGDGPDEPDADGVGDAQEAEVGRSTPFALHRLAAVFMMAEVTLLAAMQSPLGV